MRHVNGEFPSSAQATPTGHHQLKPMWLRGDPGLGLAAVTSVRALAGDDDAGNTTTTHKHSASHSLRDWMRERESHLSVSFSSLRHLKKGSPNGDPYTNAYITNVRNSYFGGGALNIGMPFVIAPGAKEN